MRPCFDLLRWVGVQILDKNAKLQAQDTFYTSHVCLDSTSSMYYSLLRLSVSNGGEKSLCGRGVKVGARSSLKVNRLGIFKGKWV